MAQATRTLLVSEPLAGGRLWTGLRTIVLRECAVIARFWSVTLAPPVMTTLLYFAIFGEILGKQIGPFSGIDYIRYLSPGLIVLWVIPFGFGHTASAFLGARFFRFLEEILVSPLPEWAVMAGYVTGGVIRGVLVGAAAAITTLFVAHIHVSSVLVSTAALLLAAVVASLGGFIAALFVQSFQQVEGIQLLILTPLMYLGGVFNPVALLPDWAQKLALANPLLYMVNAVRYGLLGVSDVPVGVAFWMMGATAIVLLVAALSLLAGGKGIRD